MAIFLPSASMSAMYLADWGNAVGAAAVEGLAGAGDDSVDEPLEQAERCPRRRARGHR